MIWIDLLAAFTEFLSGILIISAFFPWRDYSKWGIRISLFLGGVAHIALSVLSNDWIMFARMVLILSVWIGLCIICWVGNLGKKILIIFLYWALAYTIDISVLCVCSIMMKQSAITVITCAVSNLLGTLSSRSLLLSISFGCRYFVRRQPQKHGRNNVVGLCLLFIPLYTIVGTGALINDAMAGEELSSDMIALSGGLLCIDIILFAVLNKLETDRIEKQDKLILQRESAYNHQIAKTYQESFQRQRRITHEFNNQLNVIENLLSQGEYDRACKYVQHLQTTTRELAPVISTNHAMIDAILNQKYHQATQKGVGMLIFCNDLSDIPLKDEDIVTLLGNLLDNAINSSVQSNDKQILVRMLREQGIYQFVIKNSCPISPVPYSEQDAINHGFGLDIVGTLLDSYSYPYCIDRTSETFIFSAILG